MQTDRLQRLDLHLNYEPGEVIATNELVDVGAGMYPCYYTQTDSSVLVSTSVTELISELDDFHNDPDFDPPEYLVKELLDRPFDKLSSFVRNSVSNSIEYWL